ncbi:hypothetical protein DY000_02020761 [Brassica cretica]|uniref:Uncharacterized protein n=1 Tax=Brassica cretica TaxID=69181 RepID=A0ABQ7EH58_BRACR|nr:hypothetical protein DY000_02020761 [Brassica cretica]
MDREARGGSLHGFRTWCQPSNRLSFYRSSRCRRAWKQYMQPDIAKGRFCPTEGQSNEDHFRWEASQHESDQCSQFPLYSSGSAVRSYFRPVSFFMVKPRFCPSRDQSSPLQSSRQSGFGQVLSDQPAASRLEHLQVPVIFKDSVLAGGRTIWCFLNLVPSGFKETPYSLDREPSERRGHVPWLSGYTDGVVTGSDPTVLGLTCGDPADIAEDDEKEHEVTRAQVRVLCCVVLECRRGLWNPRVLTLSPKSGLGTELGMVALGKDDRIAWSWTLGPPV